MSRTELAPVVGNSEIVHIMEPTPPAAQHAQNPLVVVHSLLRGRYWLASILAIVGIAVGSVVGYRLKPPVYRSTGLIRVKPILPRILYQNEQNGVMPMFDSFVESQVSLITSQRVTDLAMQSDDWRAFNRGLSPEAVAGFTASVEVAHPKGSEMISVSYNDRDEKAAMVAVKSIIEAYQKVFGESDINSDAQILQALEDRRTALTNDLKAKNDRILSIAKEFGSDSLEKMYSFKLEELEKLESELRNAELKLASAAVRSPVKGAAGAATQPAAVTPELVAQSSPLMRSYLNDRRQLESQLQLQMSTLGDKHRRVIETRAMVAGVEKDIQAEMDLYKSGQFAAAGSALAGGMLSLDELKVNVENIKKLHEAARTETLDLGNKRMQIDGIRADADTVKQRLKDTEARIEQLNVESPVRGRISVVSMGDRPLKPAVDKRMPFAAVGGFGLGGLGCGLLLMAGLLDRRVRHIADVRSGMQHEQRLLGVLPVLPDDLSDPEQAVIAAHSVHQIRVMLEAQENKSGNCRCIAITSPSPGAGKTSLAMALGLSFSASGSRTLLIDCDIIGGGLTRRMFRSSKFKLGQILRRASRMTDQQAHHVLEKMGSLGLRFGEAAVKFGYVSQIDVDKALRLQEKNKAGLREVRAGRSLDQCVIKTGTPGMYILPLGSAERRHVGELSTKAIQKILDQAATSFDTVLIDTGPILGSLEACMVATAVDQVVMTLHRGENRGLYQRAVETLAASGANIAGIVFNRASSADVIRSGYSSSFSLASGSGSGEKPLLELDKSLVKSYSQFGPVATAVIALSAVEEEVAS